MGDDTRYRLVCHEDYGRAIYSCVFDEGEGGKDCDWPLCVNISKHPQSSNFDDEFLVSFSVKNGSVQKIRLPSNLRYKYKISFGQPEICCQDENFELPVSIDPNVGTCIENTKYECLTSEVDAVGDALIAGMKKTHPRIWTMIHKYLDDYFDPNPIINITFRDQAAKYLKESSDMSESAMYPPFLISISEIRCGIERVEDLIPILPQTPLSALNKKRPFPAEIKPCDPLRVGYDEVYASDEDDIKRDRACFWDALAISVPNASFDMHLQKPLRILEIGCGAAVGSLSLVEYFKEMRRLRSGLSVSNMEILYTGVDIDQANISRAKEINPPEFDFFAEDAFEFFKEHSQNAYDVVLFRHPGPFGMQDGASPEASQLWAGLMKGAYDHLAPHGILITSTINCYEHLFVLDLFKNEFGATVYAAGRNPYSDKRDAYLIIVGKPKRSHVK